MPSMQPIISGHEILTSSLVRRTPLERFADIRFRSDDPLFVLVLRDSQRDPDERRRQTESVETIQFARRIHRIVG